MALQFAKGVINWAAAEGTGAKTVTGLAFQPVAVIFFSSLTQTTGSYVVDEDLMLGCATSSSQEWVIHATGNNQVTSTLNARGRSTTACIRGQINGSATIDFEADFTTFTADGFTVNLSNSPTNAIAIHYLAIGGSDITNAKAGTITLTTAAGAQSFTDPGFQPDMVLFGHSWADAVNLKFNIGAATGSGSAFYAMRTDNNGGATVQSARCQRAGALVGAISSSVAINFDFAFTGFTASGFDLSATDAPAGNTDANYLAIKGGQWKCGVDHEGTSAAAKDTALAFTPTGLFLFGQHGAADATYNTSADCNLTLGASDGTNEGCVTNSNKDAHVDSPAYKRHDITRAFWHQTSATSTSSAIGTPPATNNEADASFGANKFTLTWTQAGASREFVYLAGGSAAAAATSLLWNPAPSSLYSR